MNALEQLEKWCRKHYCFKLEGGPFCQPGDDAWVGLYAAGRKVEVSQIELEEWDDEGNQTCQPTFSDLILEALKRWHADRTPKKFSILFRDDIQPPQFSREHLSGKSWWLDLVAETEADALEKLRDSYKYVNREPTSISIWEKGPAT